MRSDHMSVANVGAIRLLDDLDQQQTTSRKGRKRRSGNAQAAGEVGRVLSTGTVRGAIDIAVTGLPLTTLRARDGKLSERRDPINHREEVRADAAADAALIGLCREITALMLASLKRAVAHRDRESFGTDLYVRRVDKRGRATRCNQGGAPKRTRRRPRPGHIEV